jgi:phosphatidylinositol phospholipase C delta
MSLLNIDGFTDGESTLSEISFSMFCDIMNTCCAFDPKKKVEYQDMTRPLTNYFIATSHNTYLTGDQIKSHSSYQRYIDDLVGGCRCVEIDIWDGGEKENYDPVVYHGHTLTSKISFREVVEVCAQYAFASTPYPLILSLENHCSLEQQKIVADTLKAEFGDSLLLPGELIVAETLPSPEQLKYRVLVKGKRPMMLSRVLSGKSNSSQSASDFSYDENNNYDSNDSDNDDDDDTDDERVNSNSFSTGKIEDPVHHVHPDLAAITYLKAYNLRNIKSESDAVSFPPDVILSCSESKFLEMTSDDSKTAVLKLLCRRHLMYVPLVLL